MVMSLTKPHQKSLHSLPAQDTLHKNRSCVCCISELFGLLATELYAYMIHISSSNTTKHGPKFSQQATWEQNYRPNFILLPTSLTD